MSFQMSQFTEEEKKPFAVACHVGCGRVTLAVVAESPPQIGPHLNDLKPYREV